MKTIQVSISDELYTEMEEYKKITSIPLPLQMKYAIMRNLKFFQANKGLY